MNKNEKLYLESALNLNKSIIAAQNYVLENFKIKTKYDEDTNTLHIYTDNINESLYCAAAKEYLDNSNIACFVKIQYGL